MSMVKENGKSRIEIRGSISAQLLQKCERRSPKYRAIAGQVISIILSCYHHKLGSAFKAMLRTLNQNVLGLLPSCCSLRNKHPYTIRPVAYDIYMSKSNLKNLLYLPYDIHTPHTPLSCARCSKGCNLLKPGY
jgi:hypothetical protein